MRDKFINRWHLFCVCLKLINQSPFVATLFYWLTIVIYESKPTPEMYPCWPFLSLDKWHVYEGRHVTLQRPKTRYYSVSVYDSKVQRIGVQAMRTEKQWTSLTNWSRDGEPTFDTIDVIVTMVTKGQRNVVETMRTEKSRNSNPRVCVFRVARELGEELLKDSSPPAYSRFRLVLMC